MSPTSCATGTKALPEMINVSAAVSSTLSMVSGVENGGSFPLRRAVTGASVDIKSSTTNQLAWLTPGGLLDQKVKRPCAAILVNTIYSSISPQNILGPGT